MKELWVEKYRPATVEGYVFRDDAQIQKFGYGERTENLETSYSFYGRRKKPAATAATADAKKPAKKK